MATSFPGRVDTFVRNLNLSAAPNRAQMLQAVTWLKDNCTKLSTAGLFQSLRTHHSEVADELIKLFDPYPHTRLFPARNEREIEERLEMLRDRLQTPKSKEEADELMSRVTTGKARYERIATQPIQKNFLEEICALYKKRSEAIRIGDEQGRQDLQREIGQLKRTPTAEGLRSLRVKREKQEESNARLYRTAPEFPLKGRNTTIGFLNPPIAPISLATTLAVIAEERVSQISSTSQSSLVPQRLPIQVSTIRSNIHNR